MKKEGILALYFIGKRDTGKGVSTGFLYTKRATDENLVLLSLSLLAEFEKRQKVERDE